MFEKLCGNCTHKNCCTDSAVPLVFSNDLKKLQKSISQPSDYLKTVRINNVDVNAIKKKDNSTECIFWDNETSGCKIYDSRPFDCRLYPFDIMLIDDSYHWIVYSCNPESDWTWSEDYLLTFENDDGFDDLMKNIDLFSEHTKMVLPTESDKTPFIILRKVIWKN